MLDTMQIYRLSWWSFAFTLWDRGPSRSLRSFISNFRFYCSSYNLHPPCMYMFLSEWPNNIWPSCNTVVTLCGSTSDEDLEGIILGILSRKFHKTANIFCMFLNARDIFTGSKSQLCYVLSIVILKTFIFPWLRCPLLNAVIKLYNLRDLFQCTAGAMHTLQIWCLDIFSYDNWIF